MVRTQGYRLLTAALAVFLVIVLVACGSPEDKSGNGAAVVISPASEVVAAAVAREVSNPQSVTAPSAPVAADAVQDSVETPVSTLGALDANAIVAAQEEVLGNIYRSALPSVVRIEVAQEIGLGEVDRSSIPPQFRRFFDTPDAPERLVPRGQGSGFVWSANGYVVTNHHVIADADKVTVILADGSEFDAEVLGSDPDSDLAVLKIEPPDGGIKALELGDSGKLSIGQLAIAIGVPFGQDFTMTRGIVSALGRTISSVGTPFSNPEVIQTDAPINPGNSGGPLLDREGRVIGINSQILSSSGASAGVGFAVPINTARRVVPELISKGTYEYAYLGIQGGDLRASVAEAKGLDRASRGVIVGPVVEGGPAAKAGLTPNEEIVEINGERFPTGGDVITSIDGIEVTGMGDLLTYLVNHTRPGDMVTLGVIRGDGVKAVVEVTLGRRSESGAFRPPA